MNQETMTKTVKRYGNSGGVYLPSSWVGGTVEISLLSRPPMPEQDLPLAFAGRMQHIISMLLYGSYARGEFEEGSDIDVIVVTDSHQKGMAVPAGLKEKGYDITIMPAERLIKAAGKDALLSKSLEDAKALFNDSFLIEIKSIKPARSLSERIELSKSSVEIMKSLLAAGSDASSIIYPLMMRTKEMLLIDCILNNRKYSLRLVKERIQRLGIPESEYRKLMSAYRAARDGKRSKPSIKEDTIRTLLGFLEEMISHYGKKA